MNPPAFLGEPAFFAAAALLVAAAVSFVILLTRGWHLVRTARGHDRMDIHAIHRTPTPRIGGIAVILGFLTALFFVSEDVQTGGLFLLVSALPLVIVGLREDLSLGARPRTRLLAAIVGSATMILLTGRMIGTSPIPFIDPMFDFLPLAVLITLIGAAGMAHACNLIDGLNGLAGGYVVAFCIGLAAIGHVTQDERAVLLPAALGLATLGFLVFNYPRGLLFLGDAGAYFIGHVLAWLCIGLMARQPEVSPVALLLLAFWPVVDTLAAMVRRLAAGRPMGQPDRLHFHHLMFRLVRARLAEAPDWRANAVASAILAPLYSVPIVVGVICATHHGAALAALVTFVLLYVASRHLISRAIPRARTRQGLPQAPGAAAPAVMGGRVLPLPVQGQPLHPAARAEPLPKLEQAG